MGDEGGDGRVIVLVGSDEIRVYDRGSSQFFESQSRAALIPEVVCDKQISIHSSRSHYRLRSLLPPPHERPQLLLTSRSTSVLAHRSNLAYSTSTYPLEHSTRSKKLEVKDEQPFGETRLIVAN